MPSPAAGSLLRERADDRRQIELHAPSEEVLAAVRAAAGSSLVSIAPPRERLEAHFRRIIADARKADAAAGAAKDATR